MTERHRSIGTYAALTASDVMVTDLLLITEDESLASAWELLARGRFHQLPVLRDGHVVGVLSDYDLVRLRVPHNPDGTRRLVGDTIAGPVVTVTPGAPLVDALDLLDRLDITAVAVVPDDGGFLGLVTHQSVVAALGHLLPDPVDDDGLVEAAGRPVSERPRPPAAT